MPPALSGSDAAKPAKRVSAAPDWSLVPFKVGCARCGHDLRGLTEPRCPACALEFDWSDAVPIEKLVCRKCKYHLLGLSATRCPECGESFTWKQALDDYRRSRKPIFEYRWRSEPIRSLARTWSLAFRPWKLWRIIDLHDPPRIGPLIAMALVMATTSALALMVLMAAPIVIRETLDDLQRIAQMKQRGLPTSQFSVYSSMWAVFWYSLGSQGVLALIAIVAVWFTTTFASLMVFQQSMRRGRIRIAHVFRLWVLAVVAPTPLAALVCIPMLSVEWGYPGTFYRWGLSFEFEVLKLLVVAVFASLALVMGYHRYLKMPHSLAVVVASQVIALLATSIVAMLSVVFL